MIERPLKRLIRNDRQLSAEEFNRAFDQIEDNSRAMAGEGGYETSDTETVKQIVESGPIWIMITGGTTGGKTGGAMSWLQVVRLTAATQPVAPGTIPYIQAGNQFGPWIQGAQSSDTVLAPAYERNGNPVLTGTIVRAEWDMTVGGLIFDRDPVVRTLRINSGANPMPGNVYPANIEAYTSPLQLADFTPAFLVEPNGNQLGAGYYVAMLLDQNFEGSTIPLFVVRDCCGAGPGVSSSGITVTFIQTIPCCPTLDLPSSIYAITDNIYTAIKYGAASPVAWPSWAIPGDLVPLTYSTSVFFWYGVDNSLTTYASSPKINSPEAFGCVANIPNGPFLQDAVTGDNLEFSISNSPAAGNQFAGGQAICALPAGFLVNQGSPAQSGGEWIQLTDPSAVQSVFWDDCPGIDINICFTISGTGSDLDATWEVSYRGRGIWRSQKQFNHSDGHPYAWILFRDSGSWYLWLIRVDNYPNTTTLVYSAAIACGLPEQINLQNSPFGLTWPATITLQTCTGNISLNCSDCAIVANVLGWTGPNWVPGGSGQGQTIFAPGPCYVCVSVTGAKDGSGICPAGSGGNANGSYQLNQGAGQGAVGNTTCQYIMPVSSSNPLAHPKTICQSSGAGFPNVADIVITIRLNPADNTKLLWIAFARVGPQNPAFGQRNVEASWYAITNYNTMPTTLTGGNDFNFSGGPSSISTQAVNGSIGSVNWPTTINLATGLCPTTAKTPPTVLCLTVTGFANNLASDCANANSPAGGWVMQGQVQQFPQGPVGTYNSSTFTLNGRTGANWNLVVNYNPNNTIQSAQLLLLNNSAGNVSYEYYTASGTALTFPLTLTKVSDSHSTCVGPATVTVGSCAAALTCSLSGTPTTGTKPLQVAFTATATGGQGPYTFTVNLGDGNSVQSTQSSPYTFNYTYSTQGTYIPTLTVTDSTGTNCTASAAAIVVQGITRTGFGNKTASSATSTSWTPTVTIPANSLVLIGVSSGTSSLTGVTCTFNGTGMTLDRSANGTDEVFGFSLKVTSTTVNPTIVFSSSSAITLVIIGVYVQGLVNFVADKVAGSQGSSSTPSSGATATTTTANEYVQGWIAELGGGTFGTPQNSFTQGQTAFTGAGGGQNGLDDIYRIVSSTGTFNAADNQSQTSWAAIVITYS